MSSHQAIAASRALSRPAAEITVVDLARWVSDNFPGITAITTGRVQLGAHGAEPGLIGNWYGLPLRFRATTHGHTAVAHTACACCKLWARAAGAAPELRSAADIARKYDITPPARVARCFHCRWLHPAQERATTTHGWYQRAMFRYDLGHTPEDVLAMDCQHPQT